jgi:hypothetical protein
MFEVTATATYVNADGSEARPPYSRTWGPLEKNHVVDHLEMRMIRALDKMNDMAIQVNHGKAPHPTTTNPSEMRLELMVLEDGKKWARTTFEWPKMGDEQVAMTLGILEGELEHIAPEVKAKEHAKGKKK